MTVLMRELPVDQRPRERLLRLGAEALSDPELIALVLRSGLPGNNAIEVATRLLADYGGVGGLAAAHPEELARQPGVGAAKAASLVAAFRLTIGARADPERPLPLSSPEDVAVAVRPLLCGARREKVVVLVCDTKNRLRQSIVVSEGTVDRAQLPIREVLNAVLRHDGRAFAVAHNHPSGDPAPSKADREATWTLMDAARAVGLRFLDHVIVAGDSYASAAPGPSKGPGPMSD